MPFKDPDPTDPNMLVGVMLPADAEATRDMAYVFAEEFARMGYSREQLLWLFKNPFYGGAHGAYRALGETRDSNDHRRMSERLGKYSDYGSRRSSSSRTLQPPPLILPRDAGEDEGGGLNGAQRLNDLNDWNELNPTEEERDDGKGTQLADRPGNELSLPASIPAPAIRLRLQHQPLHRLSELHDGLQVHLDVQ